MPVVILGMMMTWLGQVVILFDKATCSCENLITVLQLKVSTDRANIVINTCDDS